MDLKTGKLTEHEIEAVLDALPGDITFIGSDDTIRYFNEPVKRLFARDAAIIGTSVQRCHPEKSIPVVDQVLDQLKTGSKDVVESWMDRSGVLVNIRYFAVRGPRGEYLGCLEFAQDVSHVKRHGSAKQQESR